MAKVLTVLFCHEHVFIKRRILFKYRHLILRESFSCTLMQFFETTLIYPPKSSTDSTKTCLSNIR